MRLHGALTWERRDALRALLHWARGWSSACEGHIPGVKGVLASTELTCSLGSIPLLVDSSPPSSFYHQSSSQGTQGPPGQRARRRGPLTQPVVGFNSEPACPFSSCLLLQPIISHPCLQASQLHLEEISSCWRK